MTWTSNTLIATVILVGFLWVFGVRTAVQKTQGDRGLIWKAILIFLAVVGIYLGIGATGIAQSFNRFPPPFAFFFVSLFILSFALALSPFGTVLVSGLNFSTLIAFHGFRALAEMVLFLAYQEGLAPIQMTFEGFNFDILISGTALLTAFYVRKGNRVLIWIWNCLGLLSLLNILVIAILSMPTPLRYFQNEPSNIWVTGAPYILLPGVLVVAALTGHFLIFRKLKRS